MAAPEKRTGLSEDAREADKWLGRRAPYRWLLVMYLGGFVGAGACLVNSIRQGSAAARSKLTAIPWIVGGMTPGIVGGAWSALRFMRRAHRVGALGLYCCVRCIGELPEGVERGACPACGRPYRLDETLDAWMRAKGWGKMADEVATRSQEHERTRGQLETDSEDQSR
jgi:hypothetical protein